MAQDKSYPPKLIEIIRDLGPHVTGSMELDQVMEAMDRWGRWLVEEAVKVITTEASMVDNHHNPVPVDPVYIAGRLSMLIGDVPMMKCPECRGIGSREIVTGYSDKGIIGMPIKERITCPRCQGRKEVPWPSTTEQT